MCNLAKVYLLKTIPAVLFLLSALAVGVSSTTLPDHTSEWLKSVETWEDLEKGPRISKTLATLGHLLTASPYDNRTHNSKADLVRFYLYTDNTTRFDPQEIIYNDKTSVTSSKFNSSLAVKIFIHGFGHKANCSFPQETKDILMGQGYKLNIIAVDWGALSMNSSKDPLYSFLNYKEAVANVPIVGQRVGSFITFLYRIGMTNLNKVHIVGFSLGAHVAGHAGHEVHTRCSDRVARITGLDPAGPLFLSGDHGRHLNKRDANFVDFVHTDMGQSGTLKSKGHANFFVNSGFPPQPGCMSNILRGNFLSALPLAFFGSCSHNSAPLFYAQSLTMDEYHLTARHCTGYMIYKMGLCLFEAAATLGEKCEPSTFGNFYLNIHPMVSSGLYSC